MGMILSYFMNHKDVMATTPQPVAAGSCYVYQPRSESVLPSWRRLLSVLLPAPAMSTNPDLSPLYRHCDDSSACYCRLLLHVYQPRSESVLPSLRLLSVLLPAPAMSTNPSWVRFTVMATTPQRVTAGSCYVYQPRSESVLPSLRLLSVLLPRLLLCLPTPIWVRFTVIATTPQLVTAGSCYVYQPRSESVLPSLRRLLSVLLPAPATCLPTPIWVRFTVIATPQRVTAGSCYVYQPELSPFYRHGDDSSACYCRLLLCLPTPIWVRFTVIATPQRVTAAAPAMSTNPDLSPFYRHCDDSSACYCRLLLCLPTPIWVRFTVIATTPQRVTAAAPAMSTNPDLSPSYARMARWWLDHFHEYLESW